MAPYFLTSLIPHRQKRQATRPLWTVLRSLTWLQWAHYFSGWLAWTCDATDFFSVSLSVSALSDQFKRDTTAITSAITLTLLLRSAGALIFGILSDRYGRKWPLVINLIIIAILELSAGFVNTFEQFLAVRSLFGIGMGGIWGMAASTALENLPVEVRGLASGFLQQGYAVGYLIAAVINLFLVPKTKQNWRTLFWTASGISILVAAIRASLPESEVFLRAKREAAASGDGRVGSAKKTRVFLHETKEMLKKHWLLCIYAILIMSGFNFLAHGSQDLYPTYLEKNKLLSTQDASIATIIGNCGAVAGGVLAGFISQYLGRRLTIVIMLVLMGAFIPLWILPTKFGPLAAGAFFIQFGEQGSWGVVPVFLSEISPPAFRATFAGVAYQIGNMVSSASAQIEATGGEHQTTVVNGQVVPNYALVQGILIGVVAIFTIFLAIVGPEHLGSHFEQAKVAFEEGAGKVDAVFNTDSVGTVNDREKDEGDSETARSGTGSVNGNEKRTEKGDEKHFEAA